MDFPCNQLYEKKLVHLTHSRGFVAKRNHGKCMCQNYALKCPETSYGEFKWKKGKLENETRHEDKSPSASLIIE